MTGGLGFVRVVAEVKNYPDEDKIMQNKFANGVLGTELKQLSDNL